MLWRWHWCYAFDSKNKMTRNDLDPKWPIFTVDETSFTHALTITNYCRFHTIHRIAPSKLHKKWRKYNHYYRIITQKTRKKPLKQDKITILLHFSELSKHQILSQSSIFSISLVFNLIPDQNKFLCYRILHFLNKTKRESFCKRLAEKHARSPENEPQKAIFTPSEWQKWEGKWGFSAWKTRKIQK